VYPFLKAELSMHWQPRKISATAHKVFDCLIEEGLLKQSADELQVNGSNQQVIEDLSRGVLLSLERFYLTISVLKQNGAGAMTRMELEKTCGALAEKLSELKSLNSPEFFDKALFKGFIEMLFNEGIIWADDNGKLAFGRVLESVIEDAGLVMSQQVRKSVHSLVD
jgi:glycerol-3-phosphate O-acyltransferase